MSLVFHLFSLIAFVFLSVWLIRLKQQLEFSRNLVRLHFMDKESKVYVECPQVFLKKFAQTFAVPLDINANDLAKPHRISLKTFTQLFFQYGMSKISLGDKVTEIKLSKVSSQDLRAIQERNANLLGDEMKLRFTT